MLNPLDDILREIMLYETSLDETDPQTVRFQPPDDQLRQDVVALDKMALSVYLTELRENRHLRSNDRGLQVEDGLAFTEQAPERVDCHYLISAWSPTQRGAAIEPTLEEHGLLWETVVALLHNAPLNPEGYYGAGNPALVPWTPRFQNVDLPTQVLTTDGYAKLAEFWMTMGDEARWKPAIHLVVTLPVAFVRHLAGAIVTTTLTNYLVTGTDSGDLLLQIGGHVRRTVGGGQPSEPMRNAWVRIERLPAGTVLQRTQTNELGEFQFDYLQPAVPYRLRTGAPGYAPLVRDVTLPSPTGEYDFLFP